MTPMLLTLLALAAQPAAAEQPATPAAPDPRPYVALVTDVGTITVRIEDRRAPVTAKNFLRYVDTKRMDGFKFYRSTRTWVPARTEDGRVGKGWVSPCESRWVRDP